MELYALREKAPKHIRDGFIETLQSLNKFVLTADLSSLLAARYRDGIQTYILTLSEMGQEVVVATASLFIEQKIIHNGARTAHVEDVAVRHGYERRGYGSIMMNHCRDIATTHGCYKIVLNCNDDNRSFYEKLGYHKCHSQMRIDIG